MRRDNLLSLLVLCLLLVIQPFLHDLFGTTISVIPVVLFAIVLLYLALRPKQVDFKEDEQDPKASDETTKKP